MALNLRVTYPDQTVDDAAYPQGKARNEESEGNGTGTPYEEQIVNDQLGFQQAILQEAGITPTNDPDTALASQYLDGLDELYGARQAYARINVRGTNIQPDEPFSLQLQETSGGISLLSEFDGENAQLSVTGVYLVNFHVNVSCALSAANTSVALYLDHGGSEVARSTTLRSSTSTSDIVCLSGSAIVVVDDVADWLSLRNGIAGGLTASTSGGSRLNLVRLAPA